MNDEIRTPAEPEGPSASAGRARSHEYRDQPWNAGQVSSGQEGSADELLFGRDEWMHPEMRLASEDLAEIGTADQYSEDAALDHALEVLLEDELNHPELLLARTAAPGLEPRWDEQAWLPVERPPIVDSPPSPSAPRPEAVNRSPSEQLGRPPSEVPPSKVAEAASIGDEPDAVDEVAGAHLLSDEELEEVGRGMVDLLHPETWAKADIGERMVMAQRAHAYIREAYGLDASPLFYDLSLPPQVAGRFESNKGQVSINAALLEDDHPGELLDTLAHENRHAVQAELIKELRDAREQELPWPPRQDVNWSVVDGWGEAWRRYDANDAPAYYRNELEVDARRAGLQLAGNGYWRAYMDRLAGGGAM